MKRLTQYEKEDIETPREVIKKLISLSGLMMKSYGYQCSMINLPSHMYNEKLSEDIYKKIKAYYKELKDSIYTLKNKYV